MTQPSETQTAFSLPVPLAAAGVLFASVCFGIVPYFSRGLTDQGLAPQSVAFYRYVVTALVLMPALIHNRRHWREITWGIIAGGVMGLGWVSYVAALKIVPASTVGVLYMTYPVFTVVIAWLLFGDAPTRKALLAAGMIVLAALVAANPAVVPADQLPALLMSLAAPFGFGFGICVLVHRLARIAPLARIGSVSLGSFLSLLPLVLSAPADQVVPQGTDVWFLIIGIALLTALVPQLIYTICSPLIGASRTAVIGSVELPTMFLIGIFAFGEQLRPAQGIACVLIVGAIALTGSRAARNVTTHMTKK